MEGSGLLALWDAGARRIPLMRGALLLAVALPESDARDPMDVGIGKRDNSLLRFREEWLGRRMPCLAACPRCEAMLEFDLDARELRAPFADPPIATARDLAEAASYESFAAKFEGVDWEEADPQAEIRLELACADCGHAWAEPFDIVDYLWAEIGDRAKRLTYEVHALASAYGWTEAEVLRLPAERRRRYLEMVAG